MAAITVTVDVTSQPDSAATKVTRVVDAVNYTAAYENESLYPVMEAVIEWYQQLPAGWETADPDGRLAELKNLIETTETEKRTRLEVTEPQPGLIRIHEKQ